MRHTEDLEKKIWMNTFGLEIDDFTQEKPNVRLRRYILVKYTKLILFNNAKSTKNL